ncbi:hypothetical protein D3C79_796760 [compost metagenome]
MLYLFRLRISGQTQDYGSLQPLSLLYLPYRLSKFGTAHDRHVAIGNDNIESVLTPAFKSRPAVFRLADIMTQKVQLLTQYLSIDFMIIDDQYLQTIAWLLN